MDETFVNPYTFVPLPAHPPKRGEPHGHLGKPELLSGKLTITIEAVTRLLIRGFGESALPRRPDGTAFIPGSSLKGATRALHETLTGSCLRVLDEDFVPSYRDQVESGGDRLLAVVEVPPQDGRPPEVRFCAPGDMRSDRLDQELLHDLNSADPLISGARLNVKERGSHGRPIDVERAKDGEWVVFIRDSRDDEQTYRAHIRKLTGETGAIPVEVWDRFKALVQGTDDQRTKQREERGDEVTAPVTIKRKAKNGPEQIFEVGHRYRASPDLRKGQPVWVKRNRYGITELGLAMAWRHFGATSAGERAGKFKPCTSNHELCASCRLFGSADLSGPKDAAAQRSYQGHVRFGDALANGPVTPEHVTLPPMGAPRPGAGQFYLDNTSVDGTIASKGNPPLREWGSEADLQKGRGSRQLRGRKYYWHTPEPNGREKARKHQLDKKMTAEAEAFPANTSFTADITFTDIDRAQLGGLLAALQPGRALRRDGLLQHIGGGRPLGFGSCRITVVAAEIQSSGARYGNGSTSLALDQLTLLIDEFRASLGDLPRTLWPQIAEVLDPNTVDASKVWYPPGEPWAAKGTEEFDEGFEFWKHTSGQGGAERRGKDGKPSGQQGGYLLKSLPHLTRSSNHKMEIASKKDKPERKRRS
ncbi:TIGR03986 family CRISPR-associated RAMP protein [Saccharopolyspora sp. K220]|uniref:TIGR03986 family type III CRISPR-associated RAMP protein n=1 Tax=Saccharopolyspora soli TaxID=2926618 RepID=UPI001F56BDF9|nr:TIGR03986 family CRISPR-associated RAMP protein [Saccharopolyspora soli]MCI2416191.1 TIGR03986 family CRISPR-associated RAMP protein [Saccharopolyspora soli]